MNQTIAHRLTAAFAAAAASTVTLGAVLALFTTPVRAEVVLQVATPIAVVTTVAGGDFRQVYSEASLWACSATGYCVQL